MVGREIDWKRRGKEVGPGDRSPAEARQVKMRELELVDNIRKQIYYIFILLFA
jgi:hypothetical protein